MDVQYCGPGAYTIDTSTDLNEACKVHDDSYGEAIRQGISPYFSRMESDIVLADKASQVPGVKARLVEGYFKTKDAILGSMGQKAISLPSNRPEEWPALSGLLGKRNRRSNGLPTKRVRYWSKYMPWTGWQNHLQKTSLMARRWYRRRRFYRRRRRFNKRRLTYRAAPQKETRPIVKYIKTGTLQLLAVSGYKTLAVPFYPEDGAQLYLNSVATVAAPGAVESGTIYLCTGTTDTLAPMQPMHIINARMSYEIMNSGALPCEVSLFYCVARDDIRLFDLSGTVPSATNGVIGVLYPGFKKMTNSSNMDYSGTDVAIPVPSSSAASYSSANKLRIKNGFTVFDSQDFTQRYKVLKVQKFGLKPGVMLKKFLNLGSRKWRQVRDFSASGAPSSAGEILHPRGSRFLMVQVRGYPGYTTAIGQDMDTDFTTGIADDTTAAAGTTDAQVSIVWRYSHGYKFPPTSLKNAMVFDANANDTIVDNDAIGGFNDAQAEEKAFD